jgi:hypothetical protein
MRLEVIRLAVLQCSTDHIDAHAFIVYTCTLDSATQLCLCAACTGLLRLLTGLSEPTSLRFCAAALRFTSPHFASLRVVSVQLRVALLLY